ncbi:MAG: aldehyde reductase, partial [Pseudomonadales bacterium]
MERVLVSGANGFIASHIVEQLLAAGYEVVGTVRNLGDSKTVGHLEALPGSKRLSLVAADITDTDPFGKLTADVDYVMHTASPYVMHVADPQRDLVTPAVNGTLAMLRACQESTRIKRVIVTSSMAAITDEPDRNHVLTEADWNEKSSIARNPYYFSKTQAERAAWDFVSEHQPGWALITINPFMVLGPSHTPSLNTTNQIFVDLMVGKYPVIFALTWGFVDVRDVALAHLRAMERPAASGRYLCAGETRSMRQVVAHLKRLGYRGNLPRLGLDSVWGTPVAKLLSYAQPQGVGSYLR